MKKQFFAVIILFISGNSFGQQVSSDPFELYWYEYILEFNQADILDNKVRTVMAKDMTYKKGKVKKDIIKYSIDFDSQGRPVKYMTQTEAELGFFPRYNPLWRAFHDYPVYDILEYDLAYNAEGKLESVIQTDKRTNRDYNPQQRLLFKYDTSNRVIAQSSQDIHHVIGTSRYSVMADITYKITYDGDSVQSIIKYSGAGNTLDTPSTDTLEVSSGKRFQVEEYQFGDDKEAFIRNAPAEKNETLYQALDNSSEIERGKNGMREIKRPSPEERESLGEDYEQYLKYFYVTY